MEEEDTHLPMKKAKAEVVLLSTESHFLRFYAFYAF